MGIPPAVANSLTTICRTNKKLRDRRRTARRAICVKILSTAVQLYKNYTWKACNREWPWRWLKI